MKRSRVVLAVVAVASVVAACGTQMAPPELVLSLTPSRVSDATPVIVKITAFDSKGKNGTGTVRVTSVRGSLAAGVDVTLDAYGTARAELVCDPGLDLGCLQPVRVVAEWTTEGQTITAETRLNNGAMVGAGGGSGGGGGGAGTSPDAGYYFITNSCDRSAVPGAQPSCCFMDMGASTKAPTCGWMVVQPGSSFPVSFTLVDGGSPNTLAWFTHPVPDQYFSDSAMCDPAWALGVDPAGLGARSFSFSCYRFAVFTDSSWQLVTNDAEDCGGGPGGSSVIGSYFRSDCLNMFASGHRASTRLLTGARMENDAGAWVQSNGTVYVLMTRRLAP
jgi:hypothetical protein